MSEFCKAVIIAMTIEGHTGTAEIKWIAENQWNDAHYSAFISVPYQNSGCKNLFIFDKEKLTEATKKAKRCLEIALSHCTLCG